MGGAPTALCWQQTSIAKHWPLSMCKIQELRRSLLPLKNQRLSLVRNESRNESPKTAYQLRARQHSAARRRRWRGLRGRGQALAVRQCSFPQAKFSLRERNFLFPL